MRFGADWGTRPRRAVVLVTFSTSFGPSARLLQTGPMELEPTSVAVGVTIGLALAVFVLMVAAQMYADAIANGRDGEAGLWAWLRFNL
jgi:hypothetical protein